jgi:hypothetical protein
MNNKRKMKNKQTNKTKQNKKKLNKDLSNDPAIPLLGIYPKE